jgi:hypothetical protein
MSTSIHYNAQCVAFVVQLDSISAPILLAEKPVLALNSEVSQGDKVCQQTLLLAAAAALAAAAICAAVVSGVHI